MARHSKLLHDDGPDIKTIMTKKNAIFVTSRHYQDKVVFPEYDYRWGPTIMAILYEPSRYLTILVKLFQIVIAAIILGLSCRRLADDGGSGRNISMLTVMIVLTALTAISSLYNVVVPLCMHNFKNPSAVKQSLSRDSKWIILTSAAIEIISWLLWIAAFTGITVLCKTPTHTSADEYSNLRSGVGKPMRKLALAEMILFTVTAILAILILISAALTWAADSKLIKGTRGGSVSHKHSPNHSKITTPIIMRNGEMIRSFQIDGEMVERPPLNRESVTECIPAPVNSDDYTADRSNDAEIMKMTNREHPRFLSNMTTTTSAEQHGNISLVYSEGTAMEPGRHMGDPGLLSSLPSFTWTPGQEMESQSEEAESVDVLARIDFCPIH